MPKSVTKICIILHPNNFLSEKPVNTYQKERVLCRLALFDAKLFYMFVTQLIRSQPLPLLVFCWEEEGSRPHPQWPTDQCLQ